MKEEVALVMSGGGAAGSIQLGMLHGLKDKFDFIHAYGTSTGALNAAGLAYQGFDGIKELWFSLKKNSDIFKSAWLRGGPIYGDSLMHSGPLRKLLESKLVGTPRIPATVAYVDLADGQLHYSNAGDEKFIDATLGSASVPLWTHPINGTWVDGGAIDITPLKKAIQDGHENIVVLLASPWRENGGGMTLPKSRWFRSLEIVKHTLYLHTLEVFKADIKLCIERNSNPKFKKIKIRVYAPEWRSIGTNDFDPEKIREAFNHGLEVAKKPPLMSDG